MHIRYQFGILQIICALLNRRFLAEPGEPHYSRIIDMRAYTTISTIERAIVFHQRQSENSENLMEKYVTRFKALLDWRASQNWTKISAGLEDALLLNFPRITNNDPATAHNDVQWFAIGKPNRPKNIRLGKCVHNLILICLFKVVINCD